MSNQNDPDELKSTLSVVTNLLPEMKDDPVVESKDVDMMTDEKIVTDPSKTKQEVVKLRDGSLLVTNDISGQIQHVSKNGLVSSIRSSPRRRTERIATVIGRSSSPYRRRERLIVEAEPRFRRHVVTRYDDDWGSLHREEERLRWEFENRRSGIRRTRYADRHDFPFQENSSNVEDFPSLYDDNASSVSNRAGVHQHFNHTREFENVMGNLNRVARERISLQRRVGGKRW